MITHLENIGCLFTWDSMKKCIHQQDNIDILIKDGILISNFNEENKPVSDINKLIAKYGTSKSWCHRLVNTENNSATLIAQMPGEGNRLHFHPSWNEWWYIVKGEWDFEIESEVNRVKQGDFVFIPETTIIGSMSCQKYLLLYSTTIIFL